MAHAETPGYIKKLTTEYMGTAIFEAIRRRLAVPSHLNMLIWRSGLTQGDPKSSGYAGYSLYIRAE